jgi:hypothetical protein
MPISYYRNTITISDNALRSCGKRGSDNKMAEDLKRAIPFDQSIKMTLLFLHFIGFSGWYGGILAGMKASPLFPVLTVLSGLLLMGRELYKDGWAWFVATEGILNLGKVFLLVLASAVGEHRGIVLGTVLLLGLLSSHLPKETRERRIL